MKIQVTMFILGVIVRISARPQMGPSGIISPDGISAQNSNEFASNIGLADPRGIVTSTGDNLQLTHGQASLHNHTAMDVSGDNTESGAIFDPSGTISPSGNNVPFSKEQRKKSLSIRPAEVEMANGNIYGLSPRRHANPSFYAHTAMDVFGNNIESGAIFDLSGIISSSGNNVPFSREQLDKILSIRPAGVVMANGNIYDLSPSRHVNPSIYARTAMDVSGDNIESGAISDPSGIISPSGNNVQFTRNQPNGIVLVGPAGIETMSGNNIQRRQRRQVNTGFTTI